jgi:hypothetical protein
LVRKLTDSGHRKTARPLPKTKAPVFVKYKSICQSILSAVFNETLTKEISLYALHKKLSASTEYPESGYK